MPDWAEAFPAAITVSAKDGTILYMNRKASSVFEKRGGRAALVGRNLADCHKAASNAIMAAMLEAEKANAYTITKAGQRKFIYQAPWYEDGQVAGLVEISMEIPDELPHHDRA